MSTPQVNDVLRFEAYNEDSESAQVEISWSQTLRTRTASYYIVKAENTSKSNAAVLLYIQDRFYKDEASPDHVKNIPGAKKEGNNWAIPITDRFQYGQKNASGENRFLVLHNKDNRTYQHRFLVTTVQSNSAEWAQYLANSFGAGELVETIQRLGARFVDDYLRTF